MPKLPGEGMATRPLHFIWICDCSGSMSLDGKIQALNMAIREALPQMRQVAEENPNADVLVRCLRFSHGATWHFGQPTQLQDFKWRDLIADPLQRSTIDTDVIFLMDTSGSMGGEIEAVKRSCSSFADQIIRQGADVRLGLIGFDIGGHRGTAEKSYQVHQLSTYTIGVWTLSSPEQFKRNIQSLSVGLFGGGGCYLANSDTVDIFPRVVQAFDGPRKHARVLVIISDEMGGTQGISEIVSQLNRASITTHVLGVAGENGAHQQIAKQTGGKFWNIHAIKERQDFGELFKTVGETIGRELVQKLADGTTSSGTDMGAALRLLAEHLKIPPMSERALPPVVVLISDGRPTDDFEGGLNALMHQPWGKKAVRISVAIGEDADSAVLQRFIGHQELKPLQANNPDALVRYIKWVSTAVLKSASSPASQTRGFSTPGLNVPIPVAPVDIPKSASDVW